MTGHCRDCRWWGDVPGFGSIDAAHPRVCDLTGYSTWTDSADVPTSKALAGPDNSDACGYLYTAPDFGCVQFEAKPESLAAFSVPVEAWAFLPDGTRLEVQQVVGNGFVLREDRDIAPGTPVTLVVRVAGQPTSVRPLIVGEPQTGPVVVTEDDGEPE